MNKISYKDAGVDITAGNEAVRRIKASVKATFSPHVLSGPGGFAGLIDLKEIIKDYSHPVLVQSIDGVGTKAIVARMVGEYDTLGIDLLSASANDILTVGAKPLTMLDYIATDRLDPQIIDELVSGMVKACKENNVSLIGGETAEMPDTYLPNEHDLAGIVTGVVEKDRIITGKNIITGDVVLGFASNGLHTNGYSLARKIFFDIAKLSVDTELVELGQTLGTALLAPHINYTNPILDLLNSNIEIKGMAHITGGGLLENIPRVLPHNCAVKINKTSWETPAIFKLMQKIGELDEPEMYRTFNMGIGFVLIVAKENVSVIMEKVNLHDNFQLSRIGKVVKGDKEVILEI